MPAPGTWTSCLTSATSCTNTLAADELAVVGVLAKLPWPTDWRPVALVRTLV